MPAPRTLASIRLAGDGPAKALGYPPLGLSDYAGLALARASYAAHQARARAATGVLP